MRELLILTLLLASPSCGKPGATGAPGHNASPCIVTSNTTLGGSTILCPDGSSTQIYNGQNGAQGPKGDTGAVGPQGAPGTSVAPIQFCSNVIEHYPNSFPEFGFCIGGVLYAVYWDGTHAFEALIAPGRYVSTSPQGCSFTVSANCEVSQ